MIAVLCFAENSFCKDKLSRRRERGSVEHQTLFEVPKLLPSVLIGRPGSALGIGVPRDDQAMAVTEEKRALTRGRNHTIRARRHSEQKVLKPSVPRLVLGELQLTRVPPFLRDNSATFRLLATAFAPHVLCRELSPFGVLIQIDILVFELWVVLCTREEAWGGGREEKKKRQEGGSFENKRRLKLRKGGRRK